MNKWEGEQSLFSPDIENLRLQNSKRVMENLIRLTFAPSLILRSWSNFLLHSKQDAGLSVVYLRRDSVSCHWVWRERINSAYVSSERYHHLASHKVYLFVEVYQPRIDRPTEWVLSPRRRKAEGTRRLTALTADSFPYSLRSSKFMISPQIKCFSKSVWITPAAWGAFVPSRIVQARTSWGPQVKYRMS